jgi:hypothetical protein
MGGANRIWTTGLVYGVKMDSLKYKETKDFEGQLNMKTRIGMIGMSKS